MIIAVCIGGRRFGALPCAWTLEHDAGGAVIFQAEGGPHPMALADRFPVRDLTLEIGGAGPIAFAGPHVVAVYGVAPRTNVAAWNGGAACRIEVGPAAQPPAP